MPHVIVDYSANLEPEIDFSALCEHLRQAMAGIECFPMPGIRVRALRADHVAIADGNPKHGYIDITVRLREGRPLDVRKAAAAELFEAAKTFLATALSSRSLALSLEMRDIDADLAPKTSTIRDYLETGE